MDGHGPVVEIFGTELDTAGSRSADSHQRPSTLPGSTCGQNGPFGDLCAGLEMSGTSVVEMATALLERGRERQVGRTASKTVQNLTDGEDTVSTEVSKVNGNANVFAESAQQSTGCLQFAQDLGQWRQSARTGKM